MSLHHCFYDHPRLAFDLQTVRHQELLREARLHRRWKVPGPRPQRARDRVLAEVGAGLIALGSRLRARALPCPE